MRTFSASARSRDPSQSGTLGVAAIAAQEHAHVDFVFLGLHLGERTCECARRPAPALPSSDRRTARSSGPCPATLCGIARRTIRYCGLVHGSTAPSSSERPAIRDHQVHVVVDGVAEALAARARAHGIVEAEQARLGRRQFDAAVLARELLVEAQRHRRRILRRGLLEDHFAGFAITDFDGVDDALVQVGRDDEAIHQNEDAAA